MAKDQIQTKSQIPSEMEFDFNGVGAFFPKSPAEQLQDIEFFI
jgi:hypothetical protein